MIGNRKNEAGGETLRIQKYDIVKVCIRKGCH